MNEIFQIVEALIKDGINWQEAVVLCSISVTLGFIIWVIVTGTVATLRSLFATIGNIATTIIGRTKETANSFLKMPANNQTPQIKS